MSILNRESFPERSRTAEREPRADATVAIDNDRPSLETTRSAGLADASGPTAPERCENVLAAGATWEGKLRVDTSVRIDGRFSGAVESKGTVHVANGAFVDADINAVFVVVAGKFSGQIHCQQRVDLLATGRVEAEISTRALTVQDGAVLDGRVQMNRDSDPLPSRAGRTAAATIAGREVGQEAAETSP